MIKITKKNLNFPGLESGVYGEDGKCFIENAISGDIGGSPTVMPWDHSIPALQLVISTETADKGLIRMNHYLELPTTPDAEIGTRTKNTLNALGVSDEQLEGGFDEASLVNTRVVMEVKRAPSKKDPSKVYSNIQQLVRLEE
jgi:hypothetical protein